MKEGNQSMKEDIVLYGPAEEIVKYGKYIDWSNVSCIIDNNPNNLQKKVNDKVIFQPQTLKEISFSKVVIFSTKYINQIHAQLMSFEVPEEKIVCWTNLVSKKDDTEIALKTSDALAKMQSENVFDDSDFYADFVPVRCIQKYNIYSGEKRVGCDSVLFLNEYSSKTPDELAAALRRAVSECGRVIFNIPYPCPAECTVWNKFPYGSLGRVHVIPCVMSQLIIIEKAVTEEPENKKIYVVTDKKCPLPPGGLYQPIWIGQGSNDDGFLDDRLGESISNLYPVLHEYTAFFWLWKHAGSGIIGIDLNSRFFMRDDVFIDRGNLLDAKTIDEIMKENDLILSKPVVFTDVTVKDQLRASVSGEAFEEGWRLISESVRKNQPEYEGAFEHVMDGRLMFPFSVFVSDKEFMDEYCEWLFSILLEPAYKIDISKYDLKSRHILRFFAERMMTVYLTQNPHRVKVLAVLKTD